jgi:hypothetical protein
LNGGGGSSQFVEASTEARSRRAALEPAHRLISDAALERLRASGFDVRDEDVGRLSPLAFDHINMLGRCAFILPEKIACGELRPLRDPATAGDDER